MAIVFSGTVLLLAFGLGLRFFGTIIPEGDTGVRLRSGVVTAQKITQGFYLTIPKFYEIKTFKGSIRMSTMNIDIAKALGGQSEKKPISLMWRVIDGRKFYPATRSTSASENAIGEAIIESAIHTSRVMKSSGRIQATSLASADWDFVVAKVNEQLVEKAGIKILRIDKK